LTQTPPTTAIICNRAPFLCQVSHKLDHRGFWGVISWTIRFVLPIRPFALATSTMEPEQFMLSICLPYAVVQLKAPRKFVLMICSTAYCSCPIAWPIFCIPAAPMRPLNRQCVFVVLEIVSSTTWTSVTSAFEYCRDPLRGDPGFCAAKYPFTGLSEISRT
jgi:hypothetical protein